MQVDFVGPVWIFADMFWFWFHQQRAEPRGMAVRPMHLYGNTLHICMAPPIMHFHALHFQQQKTLPDLKAVFEQMLNTVSEVTGTHDLTCTDRQ